MIFKTGNLFDSDSVAIGHGVNTAGVMGAGIARDFRDRFPNNYSNYKAACQSGMLAPGEFFLGVEQGTYIYNMASQRKPGRDASYPWLFSSAYGAAVDAGIMGLDRIAIPMIGCGIGGLNANRVIRILHAVEEIVNGPFDWEVWRQ